VLDRLDERVRSRTTRNGEPAEGGTLGR